MELEMYTSEQLLNELIRRNNNPQKTITTPQTPPKPEPTMTKTTCSVCGKETTVPFKPYPGQQIKCKDCYFASQGGN